MGKLLTLSEGHNVNYLAKIIVVDNLREHPNPKVTALQMTTVDGVNIITDMTTKEGDIRILFPVESALNLDYLAENNDFRADKNLNKNPLANKDGRDPNDKTKWAKDGFFEAKGRVRAIRLQGTPSEGYMVPVETLSYMLSDKEIAEIKSQIGVEFDTIKEMVLLKKHVPKESRQQGAGGAKEGRKARESKIIADQFRFHTDTSHLVKNMHRVEPDSWITISDKWHGTSTSLGIVMCLKPLKWYEKILQKLGVKVVDTHYDLVYASRRVIKNPDLNPNAQHFYKSDVWGDVANRVKHLLNKGEMIYGEIVGYTADGGAIQAMSGQPYDYGCEPGTNKLLIYRITQTNVDGKVMDLSTLQMQQRAAVMGIETVPILYSGYAKDKYPELSTDEHWRENFVQKLKDEYLEQKCKHCKSDVWAEGIVLRIEGYEIENYKLKSFNFLEGETKELDAGNLDMESAESDDIVAEIAE